MAQLNDASMAGELREHLEQQAAKGHEWVVYDTDNAIGNKHDLHCFLDEIEAIDFAREYQQIWNWHEAVPINSLICELKEQQISLLPLSSEIGLNNPETTLKTNKAMNLNNLDNLKDELKELGLPRKLTEEMEQYMQKDVPEFQLRHKLPADKGQVDLQLHFKQSGKSDFYYFNKYSVTLNNAKPLAEDHKYLVISPGEQNKPVFRKFDSPHEAISYFKEQKGSSELAAGKIEGQKITFKTQLATMEKDKVNFVAKDFSKTFYSPAVTQNVYVEKGKGFTAEQSANLIQGRSIYRDDLLNLGGQQYKAWIKLDFDQAKDRFDNFKTKQFHDPAYGFDLKAVLDKYNIKELADPAKREKLEESLKNGNRPLITVLKDGQETKLRIEAVPRYGQVNLFQENGRPEKREQFQIAVKNDPLLEQRNKQGQSQSRGVRI